LNLVPVGLLVLGVGVLARAVAPRYASGVVYALVGWSFVAELLGSLVQGTAWLERLSIFHYRALAPAQPVVMGEVVLTLTAAAASAVVAALLFSRRDLRCA
jgi:putative exporter of polyketide antibiotics